MLVCPTCGSDTFRLGREIKIWQTLEVRFTEQPGCYTVENDELHDTIDEGEIEEFFCSACDEKMDLALLETPRVVCKFCGKGTLALTAHLYRGGWVGDLCCWDERLGTTA